MKNLFFSALFLFICSAVQAQQYYKFNEYSEAYQELTDDSLIVHPHFDEDKLTTLNLDGEKFNLFGLDFNFGGVRTFAIQTLGDIRIDNDSSAVIIDGVFTDLDSIDGNTSLSWKIEGPSGDKIVKAQWKNVTLVNGQVGNFVNFQIWVHQKSGIIELRYGPRSASNASGYTTTNGPYAGIFYSNDQFNKLYEKTWLFGNPTSIAVDSSKSFTFKTLLGIPEDGTVWQFVPKSYLTSVRENLTRSFSIYPNPTNGIVHLNFGEFINGNLILTDVTGHVVETKAIVNGNRADLTISNGPGIYFLTLITDSGQHLVEKIIRTE